MIAAMQSNQVRTAWRWPPASFGGSGHAGSNSELSTCVLRDRSAWPNESRGSRVLPTANSLIVDCPHEHHAAICGCVRPRACNEAMSAFQSMDARYRISENASSGIPIGVRARFRPMRNRRDRTEFGARLNAARLHAGMTQPQLAKAVGMSQSTLAEAEYTAQSSSYAMKLARVTGVRLEWLVEGQGFMLPAQATDALAPSEVVYPNIEAEGFAAALRLVGRSISRLPPRARRTVAGLLADWAENPSEALDAERALLEILGRSS